MHSIILVRIYMRSLCRVCQVLVPAASTQVCRVVEISDVLCNRISYIVYTYRISYIHSDSLSTIYTATHITSNALAHCLGMLRIVPARLKLENLYTVLQSAKLPIHRVSRSEGSGYSGRRKDDIDVVAFQKILEAVAVHLHVPLDTLLRTSDSSFTNFCLPERREFRFSCADPEILKADLALSADTRSASPLSPHQHSSSEETNARQGTTSFQDRMADRSQKNIRPDKLNREYSEPNLAKFGIAVLAYNSGTEVVVSKRAYLHPCFCPEVDWPAMLRDEQETAATSAVTAAAADSGRAGGDVGGAGAGSGGRSIMGPDGWAGTNQNSLALESVCSIPIYAPASSGGAAGSGGAGRVIGVLQASNRRNSVGLLNAQGFLETDVNQLRIVSRSVGIALQNAAAFRDRFHKETALRDVLDGYKRASSLLHYVMDAPRVTEEEEVKGETDESVVPAHGGGERGGSGQSLERTIRHMACAAAEVC